MLSCTALALSSAALCRMCAPLHVCVLSSHPPLFSRLRKVWQKRKCTISNGYLAISHSTVGPLLHSALLLPGSCCPSLQCPQSLTLPHTVVASWGSSETSCLLLALLGCPGAEGLLLRLKSLQPQRALDKHRRSSRACVHKPRDLAPSMGWLLGKKRSMLRFLVWILRAEPKTKHRAQGRSASRARQRTSLLLHSPLMPPHSVCSSTARQPS